MAKTKVKVIVALFAVIALSLLAVCFGRLFSPAEAKAADGTYDDAAAFALMTALATNDEVTLTQDVVFDLTVPSRITGSGTMKENGHMDIVGNKTIDLAGFTLTIITGSENCCVEVTPNASLTIKDSSAAGTGKVVGQSAGDFAWGQTGTSISLTNVDVEFTSTETGAAGDEGTTPGGSSEDHVILFSGSVELSGVTFDTNVSDPVAVFTKDAETGEFVGSDVTYGTLQDAINAGETSITLDSDYTESITVSKGQNVTLDLNGHKITSSESKTIYNNGGTLTINGNGTVETTNTASTATAVFNSGSTASLTINGGTYSAKRPLDIRGANTIDINGGTFNGDAYAIYCYSSSAAISKFSVTDAKITATGTALRPHGVTQFIVDGATEIKGKTAIEVSKGAAEKIDVTLDCGKIEGKVSITNKAITASIKGGDFTNATMNYGSATVSISGGTFAEMPSPTYLASSEYAIYRNGEAGSYTFEIAATASKPDVDPYRTKDDKVTVDDRGFTSVADALEAIKGAEVTGTTIELISYMSENVTIPAGQDITLDLNGFKLTGELAVNGTLTVNEGELDGGITVDANGKLTLNAGVSRSARSAYLEADHSAVLIPSEWLPENYSIEYSEDVEWGSDPYTNEDDSITIYYTVSGKAPVANVQMGEEVYGFARLENAVNAIQGGVTTTVTLLDNVVLTGTIEPDATANITFDLNGKKISTAEGFTSPHVFRIVNSSITIKNGTIENGRAHEESDSVRTVFEIQGDPGYGTKLVLENGVTVTSHNSVAFITGTAQLDVNGAKLSTDGAGSCVIESNASASNNNDTVINITEGSEITSSTGVAIFHPQKGELNITGGTITGATGIVLRGGELNISGDAVVKATGEKKTPEELFATRPDGGTDGALNTGDAVLIYNAGYPAEEMMKDSSIAGGKFESENGSAVSSLTHTYNTSTKYEQVNNFISGGEFDGMPESDYIAAGADLYMNADNSGFAVATESAPEGYEKVVATISDTAYTSLAEAVTAAGENATIVLYADVTESVTVAADDVITLDLNGKTLTSDTDNVATILNNGTLSIVDTSDEKGTITRGATTYYVIRNEGVMTISDVNVENLTSDPSSLVANNTDCKSDGAAQLTIKSGSFTSAASNAVKNDEYGILTIDGGVFETKINTHAAVQTWATATINGGTFTATAQAISIEVYNGQTNTTTINNGTFNAPTAVYMSDGYDVGATYPGGDMNIEIKGGTFNGAIAESATCPIDDEDGGVAISGGTFTKAFDSDYLADNVNLYQTKTGFAAATEQNAPENSTKVVAFVRDKAYDKLADAVAAATDDGAVTLYVDVKENITVASGTVTIDLAGNTLNGFIKSTGATVNVKNGTVSGSWIDGAVMANGEGASVTLTDTVIGNPISISNDGAVTLVRSTTRGRITVGSGSAPENYTAGTLTITDSIIEKEISVEMLGKVVISDTVEYKTSFASGVKVTAKDPAALEAFKGYGVTTVVHVANEEQLLKALELGVSEIEVQSTELSAPVEITKDVKIYGGNKGDHEIVGSFIVKGEIEVTIEDVSFAGDGTGAALTVTDGAKLTYSDNLSNVTVAVSGFEAGISVDGNSSATVNNITFENISAAAEVKDGKSDAVTFNGCTIPEDTAQYVAVVTDATNLASAIADSKFAKVTLGADVELTSALVIERSVTLDLNGYDITGNINVTAADVTITAPETSDSAINGIVTVTNADDFTLSNVTVNYTVTGEEEADSLKGAVVIDGSENATIDNVTVNVTANNSGLNVVSVWVKNDSTATISDSTIDLKFRATKENRTQGQVVRAETSDLTIKDSVITTTDYGVIFYGDMSATDAQADNIAAFDKLVIENSTVTVTDTDEIVGAYAVSGNGSNRNGTIIEITGSTITSDVATAIYHPQYGNMTITDSVITGASGIEMRSGNLTVTSGTITATGDFEVEPNGNGNTASGVAVAVSQHTTEMKINVQLNGGTFNATGENGKAFYETDTVTGADPSADVTVDLNGGTYEAAVEAKNIKNFINDGLYKEEPKEDAFAEGYEGVLYNGYYQVVEATSPSEELNPAKIEAQADVRSYLGTMLGMTIADVKALAADETLGAAAQAVIDAYAAMDGATSLSKLAIARLSVMDAIDALDKALDTALAEYKAAAIEAINSYGAEKDVAVPTATIMAINSAKTEAEVDMYKEYAIGEIDDIVAYREAISKIEIPNYSDTLDDLSAKLDTLTGNLTSVSNTLGEKIDAVKTDIATVTADIDKLETTLAGLADSDDVNGIAEDISDIIEQLAAIKSTVDGISVAVDEATAVEEVKTEAAAEIDAWLEDYIDSIVESSATSVRDILTAKAAMADDLRSKLVDAFGEDNAALIEKYYDDAMSAIENATSASEATNAVSTFKAQVASVEAAAGNTTSLAGVYVLLAIILVVAIVAVVLAVVLKRKGGEPAPATAQPAPEAAPAPAPAAETAPAPAATEEAPAAQPEDESAATATDEDTERVVITASTRTFEEAYEALDPELRDLFDKVKAYALSKNGTTEVKLSNCICIKYGSKKVVRLTVRRSYPLAMFVIENEMVKDFRRNATGALKLKVPATELVIRDEEDLKAAYSMVDLAVDQILKDIEAAKERRRAARRARRAQREAEAGEAGETPEAPEAPDDGGKK